MKTLIAHSITLFVALSLFSNTGHADPRKEPPSTSKNPMAPVPATLENEHLQGRAADTTPFGRATWKDQMHLLFGAGASAGTVKSNSGTRGLNGGLDFQTEVGFYIQNRYSFEIGANVSFNGLGDFIIWDTLFTVGSRFRIPVYLDSKNFVPYGRVFVGYGPSVALYKGTKLLRYNNENASRIQIEGPVAGLGFGVFKVNRAGRSWFLECVAAVHALKQLEVIRDDEDVPVVISQTALTNRTQLYTLFVNVGIVAF